MTTVKKGNKVPNASYEIRDIVLGKIRGFPPWPGMVVEPSTVPPNVLKERPSNKKAVVYCVQFFPTGDYAWLLPKDISKLQKHEIESYINEPMKKNGDLLNGYRTALDPTRWEEERRHLVDAQGEEDEEEEGVEEVDELQSGDEDGKAKKNPKKRKRESEGGASAKGKATKSAKAKKDGDAAKKPRASTGKAKKNSKSKEMVESEDDAEGEGDEGPSKKASPPPAKKAKKDRDDVDEEKMLKDPEACKVRDWRHRLQKTFLSAKTVPKEQDMPGMDQLFTAIESYENMNIEYLQFSKIGKVMRHITALEPDKVPKDDEFKFQDRAKVLVEKWHHILGNSSSSKAATTNGVTNGSASAAPAPAGEAKTNGAVNRVEESKDVSMENPIGKTESTQVQAAGADGVGDTSVLADVTMSEMAD
ncbi:hypothetical protein D9758_015382 [Tetrapyrgos nigripes]|uniref:PWWP domain-containing protein n=1 Tax=Tetrapyrgos nigripes TaxID=182062 RepID=A0A8H5CAT6_9AGAR|nr:hypothetical protein D9758_015382 [Tetrapyrgos nigripes]